MRKLSNDYLMEDEIGTYGLGQGLVHRVIKRMTEGGPNYFEVYKDTVPAQIRNREAYDLPRLEATFNNITDLSNFIINNYNK